jgi:hypothetical protein
LIANGLPSEACLLRSSTFVEEARREEALLVAVEICGKPTGQQHVRRLAPSSRVVQCNRANGPPHGRRGVRVVERVEDTLDAM